MDQFSVILLMGAILIVFAACVRLISDAMRGNMNVTTKELGVRKKIHYCEYERQEAETRIEKLHSDIRRRQREIEQTERDLESAKAELGELEARVQRRKPTRHKVEVA